MYSFGLSCLVKARVCWLCRVKTVPLSSLCDRRLLEHREDSCLDGFTHSTTVLA